MASSLTARELLQLYLQLLRSRIRTTSRTTKLLGTLTLLASILSISYGGARIWNNRRTERETGRRLLRRNSGLRGKDGSRTIYVPYKNSTAKVVIHPTKPTTFDAHRRLFLQQPHQSEHQPPLPSLPPPQVKPGLNLAFLHQFLSLMNIAIPRWNSKESGLLASHAFFLFTRTYLSLLVARLDGEIVRDLVAGNGRAFIWGILKWCGVGTVAAYNNAMIKFLQSKVSIAFRTRFTRYMHDLYLNANLNYYKLNNLDGGVGYQADQYITQDLTLFCAAAASLWSSLGKPMVDLFVFNYQLYCALGPLAFSGLMTNYIATAVLLRKLSPPFGKLKAVEGRKEGEFRGLHSRLIQNAEEIAFYGGSDIERKFLDRGFKDLKRWMEGIFSLKIRYNILEDFIIKYSWSAFGYLIISLPTFLPSWGGLGGLGEVTQHAIPELVTNDAAVTTTLAEAREKSRMKDFVTNKRLMLSLADAGSRMMYSIKDLSELAGYTHRIYTLISTLHRVHASAYFPPLGMRPELFSLSDVQGTVHKGFDGVRLEDVPIVAPALYPMGGDELIESLDFIVHSGEHMLITGPNGAGKSAVARIIAGLWPVYRGLVSRPRRSGQDGIMVLPQRVYLSTGTLRDQVIYPDTEMDMKERRVSDQDLLTILEQAKLEYLPDREGGWDTRKDWKDVLSGGEKQRMGFARVLYHEPKYAVIDEGTSAVSADVEGLLYETCKSKGITLITISTRASLKRYHNFTLTLGLGENGDEWTFQQIGTSAEKDNVEKELAELRSRLEMVETWKRRRAEIEEELGKVWISDEPKELSISLEDKQEDKVLLSEPGYIESPVPLER